MTYPVDIVIPIWNRPVETRACLADLVANSPDARIIMVNYGSERETERILEEFAEALDDRAILVSTERNIGRVAAINHGITLATAEVVVLVNEDVKTAQSWLEPLQEVFGRFPDAGLVTPVPAWFGTSSSGLRYVETEYGSLGMMAVRRKMFEIIGGFDETMDCGVWCLRDYSRRAQRAGYRTLAVHVQRISYTEPMTLGSVQRRQERVKHGERLYLENWGKQQSFCISFFGQNAELHWDDLASALLTAARQGNSIAILVDRLNLIELERQGLDKAHALIQIETLPRFFALRALKKRLVNLSKEAPDASFVNASSGFPEEIHGMSAAEFVRIIEEYRQRYYTSKGECDADKMRNS